MITRMILLFNFFILTYGYEKIADNNIISRVESNGLERGKKGNKCNVGLPDVELDEQMWTCDKEDAKNNGKK